MARSIPRSAAGVNPKNGAFLRLSEIQMLGIRKQFLRLACNNSGRIAARSHYQAPTMLEAGTFGIDDGACVRQALAALRLTPQGAIGGFGTGCAIAHRGADISFTKGVAHTQNHDGFDV